MASLIPLLWLEVQSCLFEQLPPLEGVVNRGDYCKQHGFLLQSYLVRHKLPVVLTQSVGQVGMNLDVAWWRRNTERAKRLNS